ncbi:uncharacterized protein LOC127257430 [Andrographis paniculata]|uniref:uncharacterized protein LOC127257430 n=1 Tax=Andrographis paniculata TaxID=175694 RepID=UPI0021E7595C|nr:uncharacterized protein LOC127257430 [Andrographis paniculata]
MEDDDDDAQLSPPCKRRLLRRSLSSDESTIEDSAVAISSTQPVVPPIILRKEQIPRQQIVIALAAPTLYNCFRKRSNRAESIQNFDISVRRSCGGGVVAISGVYRVSDLCCQRYCDMLQYAKGKKVDSVEVIWEGRINQAKFGKFSVLHCSSDFAACKFFADHGALHYWEVAINKKSTSN